MATGAGRKCPPGIVSYRRLRHGLGGRVKGSEFREALDSLLADGRLVEVWLAPLGNRAASHLVVDPSLARRSPYRTITFRGLPRVLERVTGRRADGRL